MPTLIGAGLNGFAMVYFFQRGGNFVWLAAGHALMVVVLAWIVNNKAKALRAEEAAARRRAH